MSTSTTKKNVHFPVIRIYLSEERIAAVSALEDHADIEPFVFKLCLLQQIREHYAIVTAFRETTPRFQSDVTRMSARSKYVGCTQIPSWIDNRRNPRIPAHK